MRSSLIFAAPFVAAAFAQDSSASSSSVDAHPQTTFLTQTNSLGVVTGQPTPDLSVATLPAGATVQPVVATIPAGLPEGEHTITLNEAGGLTAFVASVGSSTTVVINGGVTISSVTTGSSAGVALSTVTGSASMASATGSQSAGAASSSDASGTAAASNSAASGSAATTSSPSGSATGSTTASASPSSSGNAAASIQIASAGLLGLGAFFAALL